MKEAIQNGKVIVPRRPHGHLGIAGIVRCLSECVTAIQQLRDRRVFYDAGQGGGGGGNVAHPFKLTVLREADFFYWQVSSHLSTVTDGTNGPMVDLSGVGFDAPTAFTGKKYIILEAAIDGSLVAGSWALSAVDAAGTLEAGINLSPPESQDAARLLIGVVQDTAPFVQQSTWEAKILTTGLVDGLAVRVFESAPVHPSYVKPAPPEPPP